MNHCEWGDITETDILCAAKEINESFATSTKLSARITDHDKNRRDKPYNLCRAHYDIVRSIFLRTQPRD